MAQTSKCNQLRGRILILLTFSTITLFAQNITVKGTVTDEQNEPLIGATVVVRDNASIGTVTDMKGNYVLYNVPSNGTLVVSFVGMRTQTVPVNGQTSINAILKEDSGLLDEVVVVGYGQQKQGQVVSAISTVKGTLLEVPSRSLTTTLAGRVSGLLAMQRSGEPGYDNAEIWIRGISSFAGGTGALVLVDGVPRNINDISPEEVESFTILKDASATAVYGAEGANGVILINSKRGLTQKTSINVRADYFINQPTRVVRFADSVEWIELYNEAQWNTSGNPAKQFWGQQGNFTPLYSEEIIQKYKTNADPDIYPNTNWMDLLKPLAQNQRIALNFRGGGDKLRFFVATSFFNEEGLFKSNPIDATEFQRTPQYKVNIGLKRYNLRTNVDMDITSSTKLKVDLSGQYLTTNYPGTGTKTIFETMMRSAPHLIPTIYSNGYPSRYSATGGFENPYTLLNFRGYAREYRVGLQTNVGLHQDLSFITGGLFLKANISFDADFNSVIRRDRNPNEYYQNGRDEKGELMLKKVVNGQTTATEAKGGGFGAGNKRIYLETSLNYNKEIRNHTFSGLLLYMQKESQLQNNPYLYKKQSVVGRASYAYKNKIFTDISFGFTGSENFAPNNRFGFFPAIGFGYTLTNEEVIGEWLKKNRISNLKLRLSYGRTGNDQVSNTRFPFKESMTWSNERIFLGMSSSGGLNQSERLIYEKRAFNPNIQWEIENKRNIGIDLGLFENSIVLHADFFNNLRKNILIQRNTISEVSGLMENPFQNYGKVTNHGFDASLNASKKINKFEISALGTFTFARNKIIEMDEIPRAFEYQQATGTKIGQVDAWIAERLYTDDDFIITTNPETGVNTYTLKGGIPVSKYGAVYPGNIKYKDMNDDGVIDEYDWVRTPKGAYPNRPEIVYGFGITLGYDGFYVTPFFQGVANVSAYLAPDQMLPFLGAQPLTTSVKKFALSRWTVENPGQDVVLPRLMLNNINANDNRRSTWWLRDAGFLRFKNLEIGYRFPKKTLQTLHLKALRVYFLGQNLHVWDKIKYWDPEMGNSSNGMGYPLQRSLNLGIEVTF